MPAVVEVEDLHKNYRVPKPRARGRGVMAWLFPGHRPLAAVAGVSLRIDAGERVAVTGPNGAGKSTTLKMLTGILEPSSGTARVHGLVPWRERRALARCIGVVFGQRSPLWGELPVRDSFALWRHVYDIERAAFTSRLDRLVERFALGSLLDQAANRLSLGQRMRCDLVVSLLHAPTTLFLDEPTIGLDITAKATLRDLIKAHAREEGQTVVLTSHAPPSRAARRRVCGAGRAGDARRPGGLLPARDGGAVDVSGRRGVRSCRRQPGDRLPAHGLML